MRQAQQEIILKIEILWVFQTESYLRFISLNPFPCAMSAYIHYTRMGKFIY